MNKYFKPNKGRALKLTGGLVSRATEHTGFLNSEGSESESKTNLRDTETTYEFDISRTDKIFNDSNQMSLAVNIESKFGTEANPSFVSHNINSLRRGPGRNQIGNTS